MHKNLSSPKSVTRVPSSNSVSFQPKLKSNFRLPTKMIIRQHLTETLLDELDGKGVEFIRNDCPKQNPCVFPAPRLLLPFHSHIPSEIPTFYKNPFIVDEEPELPSSSPKLCSPKNFGPPAIDIVSKIGSCTSIYLVQFKHVIRDCTHRGTLKINHGDFVIVELDTGRDLGVVVEILDVETYLLSRNDEHFHSHTILEETPIDEILFLATNGQKAALPQKFKDEETAWQSVLRAMDSLNFLQRNRSMVVTGVEFQNDRQLLTVYFTSDIRVDFRELLRLFYSIFTCRVFMRKTNQARRFQPRHFASMQLATGRPCYHTALFGNSSPKSDGLPSNGLPSAVGFSLGNISL